MKNILLFVTLFCFTITQSYSQSLSWRWIDHYGSINADEAVKIKTDDNGNIYTIGYYNDKIGFGSDTFSIAYTTEYALLKHDRHGNLLFADRIYCPSTSFSTAQVDVVSLAVDNKGYIYIAGNFSDSINVGGLTIGTVYNQQDAFVAKYDSDGNVIWLKRIGGPGWDKLDDMTLDTAGNIIVKTDFEAYTRTYDTISVTVLSTSDNMMLGKINPSGTFVWVTCPEMGDISPSRLAIDHHNNIYVAGTYKNGILFSGSTTYIHANNSDLLLMKFDDNGLFKWSNTPDTSGYATVDGFTIGVDDKLLVAGNVQYCAVFNSLDSFITTDQYCGYIAQYDSLGNNIWGKLFTTPYGVSHMNVASDLNNNYYMAANVVGPWMIGTDTFVSLSAFPNGPALIKLTNTGSVSSIQTSDFGGDYIDVALDHANNAYICGDYSYRGYPYHIGDSIFTTYMSSSYTDMLIAKLAAPEMILPGTQNKNSYCVGDSLQIPFTIIDTDFAAGNIFSLQLSDGSGSFAHPTMLGNINSLSSPDTFFVKLPTNIAAGMHYRLRVTSTIPAFISWSYDTSFAIYALPPKPIISLIGSDLKCTASGYTYQWYRNDTLLPGATAQTYTPAISGLYYVAITNGNGCSNASDTFRYAEGINLLNNELIRIYPNPITDNNIYISDLNKPCHISIYDLSGQCLQNWNSKGAMEIKLELNPSFYKSGVYFLKLVTDGNIYYKKIIIQP